MSKPKNEPTIKQQIDELEELIAWFEQDEVDLEEAIDKFDRGTKLAQDIKQRLSGLGNNISVLKEKFDG
jgi:exodeoxyribonuclease VII small subunit